MILTTILPYPFIPTLQNHPHSGNTRTHYSNMFFSDMVNILPAQIIIQQAHIVSTFAALKR